ncbi:MULTISPECIES: WGR domain-containing protein [Methylobacter]|jgi:predicted DNA-binding WGR domain protein|uniref:WGR domain-containing protein n=1 Tax=Methylobacter TaxID=429 RepID=UPI00041E9ABD|nr:WGR domain-containing protein [Methylobacter luteus]
MNRIYLVRNEADKNMNRFYQLIIMPGLFGDWSLIREWGRVGSPGTVRKDWFDTEEEAINAAQRLCQSKQKGGYHYYSR